MDIITNTVQEAEVASLTGVNLSLYLRDESI